MEEEGEEGNEDWSKEGKEKAGVGDNNACKGEESADEEGAQSPLHNIVGQSVEVSEY